MLMSKGFVQRFKRITRMIKSRENKSKIGRQLQGMLMYFNGGGYAVLNKLHLRFGYELINMKQIVVSPVKLSKHNLYRVRNYGNELNVKPINNDKLIEVMSKLLRLGEKAEWLDDSKLSREEVQELEKLVK